jgi:8-oxo-dGTP pyrophosphatase MutT (NUDIX family)
MEHIYSAGIITYYNNDASPLYLLLHHTAGHWDFPKGTMEPGETKHETAMRELFEETGLYVINIDDTFEAESTYPFQHYTKGIMQKTVYFFLGQSTSKSVHLSHEHTNYKWLPYKEALKQITHDRSKTILKKAHKYITTIKQLED